MTTLRTCVLSSRCNLIECPFAQMILNQENTTDFTHQTCLALKSHVLCACLKCLPFKYKQETKYEHNSVLLLKQIAYLKTCENLLFNSTEDHCALEVVITGITEFKSTVQYLKKQSDHSFAAQEHKCVTPSALSNVLGPKQSRYKLILFHSRLLTIAALIFFHRDLSNCFSTILLPFLWGSLFSLEWYMSSKYLLSNFLIFF